MWHLFDDKFINSHYGLFQQVILNLVFQSFDHKNIFLRFLLMKWKFNLRLVSQKQKNMARQLE